MERYSILERISSGGHSVVYRGEDERLHRPVCIKVFHRVKSGDGPYKTAYEHFVQEAFALSKLTHPNTLRIYDFGHLTNEDGQEGPPFQVSELMTHGTLWSQVRKNGPMAGAEVARMVTALGGALAEAHHAGIIHRDIKPHNILFTTAGRSLVVKLADFGIAKALPTEAADLRHRADDTSVVVGRPFLMYSPWWAAPEQLAGMPVGPEADVFALALSVIFMLTGNVVFRENDPIKAYEQRKSGPELVESACAEAGLPGPVSALLARSCNFDADQRPGDTEDFAAALAEGLREQASRASMPTAPAVPAQRPPELTPAPTPMSISGPPPGTAEQPRPHLQPVPNTGPDLADGTRPGAPRRLRVTDEIQIVGDRRVVFVAAPGGEVTVSCLGGGTRLRIAFVPGDDGFCIHIRGLTCFLARDQGRPTSAAQFENEGLLHMVLPNRVQIGAAHVSLGKAAAGHRIFPLGEHQIAVSLDECPQVAALDFGPGGDCLLIYRPELRTADAHNPGKAHARF